MKIQYSTLLVALLLVFVVAVLGHDHHDHDHDHDHDHHDHDHHDHDHDHKPKKQVDEVAPLPERPNHPEIPQQLLKRIDFVETFQDGPKALEKGWVASKNERYFGHEWIVASSFPEKADGSDKHEPGFKNEQSLAVHAKHRHYGLTHVLNQAFDNTNNTLVFQYEVRIHDGIGCSGAYAKLLLKQDNFDALALEEATPYVIMFGPDRCGSTNKVHFIVRQKLAEGKWEEKHMAKTVSAKTTDSYSHLYQLVIKPDNTFKILVDQHEEASGSLLSSTDFNPPFGAPKEIDDRTDSKPSDWVEEANIPDPAAKKPDGWDENAPKTIPDPDAKKPVDWSDEDDGEWMPSEIPNPEYKGKWSAPIIANPAYKGQWKPRKIPNPAFFEDLQPSNLAPIGAVSIEILANDRGIAFDNILLAHDEQAANEFASLTFTPKQSSEKSHAEAVRKAKAKADRIRAFDEDGPYGMAVYVWGEVKDFVTSNLIAVIGTSVVLFLSCFYYMCLAPVKRHGQAEGDDDKVVIPAESDEDEGEESDGSDSKKPVVEETKETEQPTKEKKTKSNN